MADAGQFKLPTEITRAYWDKHKGIIAKVFKKETGVGKAIDDATAAHGLVPWDVVLGQKAVSKKDYEAFCKGEVKELTGDLDKLSTLCLKVAGDFKSNPLIPKGPRDALAAVSSKADSLSEKIKQFTADAAKKLK